MAVTVNTYAPFDTQSVTEDTWRKFMQYATGRGTASHGVIRGVANTMQVYADGTGMSVKVKTGEAWIKGHWGEITSEITLPISAAHATLARKDLVVCRANFTNDRVEVDVVAGTPDAAPAAPGVNQSSTMYEISLAVVDVPAADTVIGATQVLDARYYVDYPPPNKTLTSTQTVSNSTTLVDVTDLTIPLTAGAAYTLDSWIEYGAATAADIKFFLKLPSGGTGRWSGRGLEVGATATFGSHSVGTVDTATVFAVAGAGVGVGMSARLTGLIQAPVVSAAGGTLALTLQFAQNTANVSNTQLFVGSSISLTRRD